MVQWLLVSDKLHLPFTDVLLLLGNDLARDKDVVNPLVTDTPRIDESPDPITQKLPGLYPSCRDY